MSEPDSPFARLLSDVPKLHYWNDDWQSGGFEPSDMVYMHDLAKSYLAAGPCTVLETGCGLSTLSYLASGADLISIAPDRELWDRIIAAATKIGVPTSKLQYHVGFSELTLPPLVLDKPQFVQIGLIDGGHNYHHVWVDFTYINYVLVQGGTMIVDDVLLSSCASLGLYLKSHPGWQLMHRTLKTFYFKKLWNDRLEKDFGISPFVAQNSTVL